ncbi:MAG: hypothetical protein Q8P18_30020 [Pseudomonadota bacterium]|nr:hypothetical protein [Pseudomonadota bacterium]
MRILLFVPLFAACATQDFGVCDAEDQCSEYTFSSEYWRLDLIADYCEGTFSYTGECAADSAVGTCSFNGEYATSVHTYYGPAFTAETAQVECETVVVGTFSAA